MLSDAEMHALGKPTEADFDKQFPLGPSQVSWRDLVSLYGDQTGAMDAILRGEIPEKYQDEVWLVVQNPLAIRAFVLILRALEK
jgi:hypothetical protein